MQWLRDQLKGDPSVFGVTGTNAAFNQGWDINGFKHNGEDQSAFVYRVEYDYLDMLGIQIIEGRNFSTQFPSDVQGWIIINETLAKDLGWEDKIVGRRLTGWRPETIPEGPEVIGLVVNYHFPQALFEVVFRDAS